MGYEYRYFNGEANFGPPLNTEVPGGTHLTFDVILHYAGEIYALRRPKGLHDGPKDALYFPHGLIRFGETVQECAQRLAIEQAEAVVTNTELYNLVSWIENEHWHMCLNVFAELANPPRPQGEVSEVVAVSKDAIPHDFAWWTIDQMATALDVLNRRIAANGELSVR